MREVIIKYVDRPFSYGDDCCTFVGECVESITGKNPMAAFHYRNKREAYSIIDQFGSLEDAITAVIGEPYDGCKDGDVCTLNANDGTEAAGIIYHDRVLARVQSGLMDYPLDRANRVWCT